MTAQYMKLGTFDLSGHVYGGFNPTGGIWDIKQAGAVSLLTNARKDNPKGTSYTFTAVFDSETDAATFMLYCTPYDPDNPSFDEEVGANIPLYIRTDDWHLNVWGVVTKPVQVGKSEMDYLHYSIEVICYLYSPYTDGDAQLWTTGLTPSLANTTGHITSAPNVVITSTYSGGLPTNITVAIADGLSLILATAALSGEVWALTGDTGKLLETYEDLITAGTVWGHDWVGSGTFDTDHMELNNGESAYIRLSGPHQVRYPVVMHADLSLDSGGATGLAYVEISADHVAWETVLTQADFLAGIAEYVLPGTENMWEIFVRIRCASGTSGKNVNIGSIKFEVERSIEDGAVPVVAAGATKTLTISATGGSLTSTGSFVPRRKLI
jgi:hypothetical protein